VCKVKEKLLKVLSLAGFYMFEMEFHKQDQVNLPSVTSVLLTINDNYSNAQSWFYQY